MAKLSEIVGSLATSEFEVSNFTVEAAEKDGSKIAVLQLTKIMTEVEGSQFVGDEATGDRERIKAYDVTTVRVHETDFETEGIDLDPVTRKGTVKCNLRLDVSNAGDVWLKSKSFASFAREKAGERAQERKLGIVTKMQERRAKAAFKTVDPIKEQPTVVAPKVVSPAAAKVGP